jgi:hypothetical protein
MPRGPGRPVTPRPPGDANKKVGKPAAPPAAAAATAAAAAAAAEVEDPESANFSAAAIEKTMRLQLPLHVSVDHAAVGALRCLVIATATRSLSVRWLQV